MFCIEGEDGSSVILKVFQTIKDNGSFVGKTRDALDFHLVISDPRKAFPFFKKQHWVWALYEGSDRLNPNFENPGQAYRFRPNWQKKLANEGGKFCYTYGDVYKTQVPIILNMLKSKQTREAVINVWDSSYLGPQKEERAPCTLTLHFLIRDGALHLFVNMRTNDAINLLPYDLWHHTLLQRFVAAKKGLELGEYHHQADHMYYPKRRDTTGIIDRTISDLFDSLDQQKSISDFIPDSIDSDMSLHYSAITSARDGDPESSMDDIDKIESVFVSDWTKILVMAEANSRGYRMSIPLTLSEFSYINLLGHHLRSR